MRMHLYCSDFANVRHCISCHEDDDNGDGSLCTAEWGRPNGKGKATVAEDAACCDFKNEELPRIPRAQVAAVLKRKRAELRMLLRPANEGPAIPKE